MEQAKVEAGQLDAIVLVGGSTLMPRVPQLLEQVTGKKPYHGPVAPHGRGPGGGHSRRHSRSQVSRR